MLKEELIKAEYGFVDNEDGTYLVHYDKSIDDFSIINRQGNCDMREDADNYYIDLRDGNGEAIYPKQDWTLDSAIKNYCC
jgi:hypothetical protein